VLFLFIHTQTVPPPLSLSPQRVYDGRVAEDHSPTRRVTVAQAAEILGLSVEAVRMRIKRDTLRSEKEAGRVYVLLGPQPTTEQPTELTDRTAELIATLREQLEAEREANRENRRIIAMLASQVPELEAPERPPDAPETATEQPGRRRQGKTLRRPQSGPGGVGYSARRKEVYMFLADPGGRYAVQRVIGSSRLEEELAKALNEGDAKGWGPLPMEYSEINPGVYIVWDKQGR